MDNSLRCKQLCRFGQYPRCKQGKLGMAWNKIWVHKATHENVHEKLDSIEVEGYTSYLSDPTHLTRPKHAGYVPLQSPLISALSDVVVSKL
jgi:hypothetical protein